MNYRLLTATSTQINLELSHPELLLVDADLQEQ
jgi:hypothetical protein